MSIDQMDLTALREAQQDADTFLRSCLGDTMTPQNVLNALVERVWRRAYDAGVADCIAELQAAAKEADEQSDVRGRRGKWEEADFWGERSKSYEIAAERLAALKGGK